jgi:hypothetical protein
MKPIRGPIQNSVILIIGLIVFLSLSISCSKSKPEITYGFIGLVCYQEEKGFQERFSFFIIPDDDDGIENLDELYLYNDREQLRWLIKSEDWVSFTRDETTWIGTRSIAIQDDESLPRGQYRAVLVNKGGESSEKNFSFDAEVRFPYPSLEITDGRYTINSSWPNNRLTCYDNEGKFVTIVELQALSGTVASLGIPSNVRTVALWAEDPAYFCSAYTYVAPVR